MKLRTRNDDSLTFELSRRERELLVFLLRRYPVLDPAYHQLSRPEHRDALAAEQRLLTEHLTEAQTANRRLVEELIRSRLTATPEAREKTASTTTLILTLAEADWLLRIVNDVRVGCWVRLGRPESNDLPSPFLGAENVPDVTAMELGGLVQMVLLDALGPAH